MRVNVPAFTIWPEGHVGFQACCMCVTVKLTEKGTTGSSIKG